MKLASMEDEDLFLVLLSVVFAAIMLVAGELILTTKSEPGVPPAHRVPSETSSHNNLPATHVAFRLVSSTKIILAAQCPKEGPSHRDLISA